jgi:hypothetical protein
MSDLLNTKKVTLVALQRAVSTLFSRCEALYIVIMKCGIERRVIGVVEQPDIAVFLGYLET